MEKDIVLNVNNLNSVTNEGVKEIKSLKKVMKKLDGEFYLFGGSIKKLKGLVNLENELNVFERVVIQLQNAIIPENIVDENKNLIYSICYKHKNYCDIDDLYQAGLLGLMDAYKNFDPSKNVKFSTYAFNYIFYSC